MTVHPASVNTPYVQVVLQKDIIHMLKRALVVKPETDNEIQKENSDYGRWIRFSTTVQLDPFDSTFQDLL